MRTTVATLPILQSGPRVRRSRSGRRRAVVLVAVHLLIAAHLVHWRLTGSTFTPLEPAEAMEFGRRDSINAGLLFFVAATLATAIFGRFFCGWGCHLVALQDASRWLLGRLGIRPRPLRSRLLAWVPLFAFAYMFLWPALYRWLAGDRFGPWHFDLYTGDFWATFPGWFIGGLTFLVCGLGSVYLLGAKGFCTYACPYGAVFGAVDRLAPMRIRVTDACSHCGHCTSVCSSNVRVHEEVRDFGMVVDPGCMKCMDCVSVCPNDALYWGVGAPALFTRARVEDPTPPHREPFTWREELWLAGCFILALLTFRGLYDRVPFLFSLGLAGCLAYALLLLVQLTYAPHVHLRGFLLKQNGRLRPAGAGYLAVLFAVLLFFGHSAVIRVSQFLGGRAFSDASDLRHQALDLNQGERQLPPERRSQLEAGARHLGRVRSLGLAPAPRSLTQLAWLELLLGAPETETVAREALAAGAPAAEVQLVLGRQRLRRGDLEGAESAFEAAIAADPRRPDPYLLLGTALAQSGDLAGAEGVFRQGLSAAGESPRLLYDLGLARALQGDTAGAIEAFEQALRLDPEDLAARENLAGALAAAGRYLEAVEHFRWALARNPLDAATRALLARALAELGRIGEARDEARRALELDPSNRQTRELLELLERSGN